MGLEPLAFSEIRDGLSNTVLVGEAAHDVDEQSRLGKQAEVLVGNKKDHWYIGSDSIDGAEVDLSECLDSTGVPPSLHKQPDVYNCSSPASAECQALQLSFSSHHPGVVQVVLCDGSVKQIQKGIDLTIWQAVGTRAQGGRGAALAHQIWKGALYTRFSPEPNRCEFALSSK